jgi:hypothetical protein
MLWQMRRTRQVKQRSNRTTATDGGGIASPDDKGASLRYERLIIAGLCLLAAIRVFAFSAAFPFFNNVDEQLHFDMVFKYSKGHLPVSPLERIDPDAAKIIAEAAGGDFFDVHTDKSPDILEKVTVSLTNSNNLETWAWPTYYLAAGLWCRLGEVMGITGTGLLYWIRFFNVPLAAVFVWLSWLFSRRYFAGNFQSRIAIPLIAAFFPQDIFFAITGDVLSPIIFAAAFIMLLEIYLREKSREYHFFAGLLVAATILTKASNIAIIPLAVIVIAVKVIRATRRKVLRQYFISVIIFVIAALLPAVLWLSRNYILFGDAVGALASAKARTWTVKPLSETFNHPILTFSGFIYFISELTKTFWRGEFIWRGKIIASAYMDILYIVSSAVFLAVSIAGLLRSKAGEDELRRVAVWMSLLVLAVSVLFLAFMSMRYDFGECAYPSADKPYFTSGRLIAGVILPFLILYIDGLQRILTKLRCTRALLTAVGVIVAVITISEITLSRSVFANPNNWFHLTK